MHYEVWLNGELYYTNIKSKRAALAIGKAHKNKQVAVYQKFPETKDHPSHTVIIGMSQ